MFEPSIGDRDGARDILAGLIPAIAVAATALVIVTSWFSRTARWLHIRVNTGEDDWPRRIAISLPLPIRLTAWGMRVFGHYIPGIEGMPIDEAILALKDSATPETPFYVEVDEPGGERVQVYIG